MNGDYQTKTEKVVTNNAQKLRFYRIMNNLGHKKVRSMNWCIVPMGMVFSLGRKASGVGNTPLVVDPKPHLFSLNGLNPSAHAVASFLHLLERALAFTEYF